jgi:ABC-type bacteriocin/lantibiotic exporter with double-glycine peptidase domain
MDFQQKKDGWCGPAALSFALFQQGKYIPQEEIVKETKTTVESGVDPKPLIDFVEKQGFKTKVFSNENPKATLGAIDYLHKSGKSVIVDYLEGDSLEAGHYVVFQGMKGNSITVWNPSTAKNEKITKKYFVEHWKDVKSSGKVFKYWALVF